MSKATIVETWGPGVAIGRYLLLKPLARGGMAEIWLAQRSGPQGFSREVVIKRILSSEESSTDFERMFLDEARIVSQLSHPNIVQVFELDVHDGSAYLVMEHLAGESVARFAREVARRVEQVPIPLALYIAQQAAQGLGYAHRKVGVDGQPMNVVHRDVSPQNLFITYEGAVKVLDFGIAKAAGRLTRTSTGVTKGKIAYMAPEHALGQEVDARADVFSLGIVLYELLTGARLYGDSDDITVLKRLLQRSEPLPRASERRADLPSSVTELVSRALEYEPAHRPADGLALAKALDDCLLQLRLRPSTEELATSMKRLFDDRIRGMSEFLSGARAGIIAESTTPSSSRPTMPGKTPAPTAVSLPPPRSRLLLMLLTAVALVAAGVLGLRHLATPGGELRPPATASASTAQVHPPEPAPTPEPPAPAPEPTEPPPQSAVVAPSPARAVGATPSRVAKPVGKMRLNLETRPWTKVFLGRMLLGETPLVDVGVPAGDIRLRLVNEEHRIDTTVELTGRPGEHLYKTFSF